MRKERGWSIALGALLLGIAAFTMIRSEGRFEAYVSGGGCLLAGIVLLVVAVRRPTR
ncbi:MULTISPECIES: hypothetical protein [Bacteria]|uniref:hypothetical protein n=1 Tax=Bacteria TaxID=2 RepID=UPI003C7BA031